MHIVECTSCAKYWRQWAVLKPHTFTQQQAVSMLSVLANVIGKPRSHDSEQITRRYFACETLWVYFQYRMDYDVMKCRLSHHLENLELFTVLGSLGKFRAAVSFKTISFRQKVQRISQFAKLKITGLFK